MTTTNMTPERLAEELKPCPFCGETELYFRGRGIGQITCKTCGSEGPEKYSQEAAEECWNYRPIEDDLLAEAKALKAEKAQAEAERDALASTWQPIETAPKDGTEILGLTATHGRYIICLDENYLRLQNGEAVRWNFTHWMPLPATPEQTSKEQLHIEFLRAELGTVESVIATLSEEDIVGRMSFEGRKKKLEAELQQAEKEGE